MRWRVLGVAVTTAVLAGLVVLYVSAFLESVPPAVSAVRVGRTSHLTLQSVGTYGHAPNPDWVSYLAQDASGNWHHSTTFKVPAYTQLTITIYQYDTQTGLRNPFFAQVRGTQGGVMTLNGKPTSILMPDAAAHTFTVPDMGISVPVEGISSTAKNPCSTAPCSLSESHNTISFTFNTGAPGSHRWQCFVPCGAKFIFGNGGPMQTIGWMSGTIVVA